ncbi:unnamed protein product, partial [Nesidiocoris tenuis]
REKGNLPVLEISSCEDERQREKRRIDDREEEQEKYEHLVSAELADLSKYRVEIHGHLRPAWSKAADIVSTYRRSISQVDDHLTGSGDRLRKAGSVSAVDRLPTVGARERFDRVKDRQLREYSDSPPGLILS